MKMKYLRAELSITALFIFSIFISHNSFGQSTERDADNPNGDRDNPQGQFQFEWLRTHDPATGIIPPHIRQKELEFSSHIPTVEQLAQNSESGLLKSGGTQIQSVNWALRGPYQIGGRTRALAVDVNDTNVIIAAGVSGGVWRSENFGGTWSRITPLNVLPSVSCIVQDKRPGKTNIWYYGTGEAIDASQNIEGDGIYKSIDDGLTWNVLASTDTSNTVSYTEPFNIVMNIAIDPFTTTQDIVYAATEQGIMRSTNGGATWTNTLQASGYFYTDVSVTPTGVVYATIDNGGNTKNVFRSDNGIDWTDITPSAWQGADAEVIAIGVAPSNENIVYFLFAAYEPTTSDEAHYFWKYTYASGDGSGSGGAWVDRSSNIPSGFYTYDGYATAIKVKPDNANTVFIGGIDIYRSTNGFADTLTTNQIDLSGVVHVDQHAFVFMPSSPGEMLAGNDGGVFFTKNDIATNVTWSSFDNGYFTSQFYTTAIDHADANDSVVIGGMQDNGTFASLSGNSAQPWSFVSGSDGATCAITNGGRIYYSSFTYDQVYRDSINDNNVEIWYTRVDPAGGGESLWLNPYAIDPNDENRMYFGGGKFLWRNDNLSGISHDNSTHNAPTTVNWVELPNTSPGNISAIAVATTPANRVYYGTDGGHLYRDDYGTTNYATPIEIDGGAGFPKGYISSIAVDPQNGDNVLVVFSNYNVQSLFYSTDGGAVWNTVGGNLEQNPDGSGNGPSCRSASIMHVNNGMEFLVGTSTGLYSTSQLNGSSTVWALEGASAIGNNVVDMVDSRQADGFVAVATHGGGMFSGKIPGATSVNEKSNPNLSFALNQNYPNPFSITTQFRFVTENETPTTLKVYDILGKELATLAFGVFSPGAHTAQWNTGDLPSGAYFYTLRTGVFSQTREMLLLK